MRINTIPKIMQEWNVVGKRRKGKPRGQWVDGVRRMLSKHLTKEIQMIEDCGGAKFL